MYGMHFFGDFYTNKEISFKSRMRMLVAPTIKWIKVRKIYYQKQQKII